MRREEKRELQERKRQYVTDAQRLRELVREFRLDIEARDRGERAGPRQFEEHRDH